MWILKIFLPEIAHGISFEMILKLEIAHFICISKDFLGLELGVWLMDLHVFHLPAEERSKSQCCIKPGPWFNALQEIGRMNAGQAFHIQHFVYEL